MKEKETLSDFEILMQQDVGGEILSHMPNTTLHMFSRVNNHCNKLAKSPIETRKKTRSLYHLIQFITQGRAEKKELHLETLRDAIINHLTTLKKQLESHKTFLEENSSYQVVKEISSVLLDETHHDESTIRQHIKDFLFGDLEMTNRLLTTVESVLHTYQAPDLKLLLASIFIQKINNCPEFNKMLSRAHAAGAVIIKHDFGDDPEYYFENRDLYLSILKELIIAGLNIDENYKIEDRLVTFLFLASCEKETQVTKMLLGFGADPNSLDITQKNNKASALICALYDTTGKNDIDPEMVYMLLDAGANMEDLSSFNKTAIAIAARFSSSEILIRLIKMSANINVQSVGNKTPLMLAIENGQFENAEILLNAGANCLLKDEKGKLAIDYLKAHPDGLLPMATNLLSLLTQKTFEQQRMIENRRLREPKGKRTP